MTQLIASVSKPTMNGASSIHYHDHRFLGTEETRSALETQILSSSSLVALSAYFTNPALDWLIPPTNGKTVCLVLRGRPSDFLTGSSSIEAIKKAMELGWKVLLHSALHAKVYMLDNHVIIGSGNLTANGMNLLSAPGNLELNVEVAKSAAVEELVNSIVMSAAEIDGLLLEEMTRYLEDQKVYSPVEVDSWWPEHIISQRTGMLFCSDFPTERYGETSPTLEKPWLSLQRTLKDQNFTEARDILESTVAYRWITALLLEEGTPCRFGQITARLHDDLKDDPAPYRSSIKTLLGNFLSFVEACSDCDLTISRPRHTQIISLDRVGVSPH